MVRLLPEQCFRPDGTLNPAFAGSRPVIIGRNAFVLYKSHDSFEQYPPLEEWRVRRLLRGGLEVPSRGRNVVDTGEYILRLSSQGEERPERIDGPPQGIFATEYASPDVNYLCKCMLALLTVTSADSPYQLDSAKHVVAILEAAGFYDLSAMQTRGVLTNGVTTCPLCLREINYATLHETVAFGSAEGLSNAAAQDSGATRSTSVNLFHVRPLMYHSLVHTPDNVGWGHAICNTRLGQRHCYNLAELMSHGDAVVVHSPGGHQEQIGWASPERSMIRSSTGQVWVRVTDPIVTGEEAVAEEGDG